MLIQNSVGAPTVTTTKRKKKRHLVSGRYNRSPYRNWTRADTQRRTDKSRLDVDRREREVEEELEDRSEYRTAYPPEDERPAARSSRVHSRDRSTTSWTGRPHEFSCHGENPLNPSPREPPNRPESTSPLPSEYDGLTNAGPRSLLVRSPTTFGTAEDPTSPASGEGIVEGEPAYGKTKTRHRQVATGSLDDSRTIQAEPVRPYWLEKRLQGSENEGFSRSRQAASASRVAEKRAEANRRGVIGSIRSGPSFGISAFASQNPKGPLTGDRASTVTTTTTTTTVAATTDGAWSTVPRGPRHRTVSWYGDSRTAAEEPKGKTEDERGAVGAADKKGGRFVLVRNGSGEVIVGGGGVVEWTTTTVAGPMSSWSYPGDEEPGAGNVRTRPTPDGPSRKEEDVEGAEAGVKTTDTGSKGSSTSATAATTTTPSTTQFPPPTRDTSMEAHINGHATS
ncbi:hypothetical protein KM043_017869 [Ampulex compressa]|nr:hypothetical protein KM043_017869 [Ampulex compressa]